MDLSADRQPRGIHRLGDLLSRDLRNAAYRGALAACATGRHRGRRRREYWICDQHSRCARRAPRQGSQFRARSRTAILQIPASFEWNGGRARIENAAAGEEAESKLDRGVTKLEVKLVNLDEVFSQGEQVSVVKLDVEGFELDALMGMEQMLRERRIRHVVFEELRDYPAPTHQFLRNLGYSVFGLDYGFFGIKCCRDKGPRAESISGLPANYVATYEPEKTVRQLEHGLRKSFGPGRYLY